MAAGSVMKHLKAARWRITERRDEKKTSAILIALAIAVVAAGLIFSWRAMRQAAPVAAASADPDSDVQLMPDDSLPFSLPPLE